MKRKSIMVVLTAAIMALSAVSVFALDYTVPEDAVTVTARFAVLETDEAGEEFTMVNEEGELVIHITNNTIIYFEDFVPVSDECDEVTQMVREVLFGRTLAEVLDGRNMQVIYEESDKITPVSIMVLFEAITPLPIDVDDNEDYAAITPLPIEIGEEEGEEDGFFILPAPLPIDIEPIVFELIGEIVVNNVIIENAPLPFLQETESGGIVMVPLRAVAEALGYNVSWNGTLRSVQLGAAIHIWINSTEAHVGRMAPIELPTAPVIINDLTFVPLDFFHLVLNQTAYVFEGQVVIETDSDMH